MLNNKELSIKTYKVGKAGRFLGAVIALAIIMGVTISLRPLLTPHAKAEGAALPVSLEPGPTPHPTEKKESLYKQNIRVWVFKDRLRPDLIYAGAGRAIIRVENETGEDVSLVVERLIPERAGTILKKVKTKDKRKRAHEELTLEAGEYIFYEESRPEVRGRLVVEPSRQ